jgi:thiol-disulfide isomerase/thioredoxin
MNTLKPIIISLICIFILSLPNELFAQPAFDDSKHTPLNKFPGVFSVGDEMPDIRFKLLDGSNVQLSDYAGKLVILDFWATWCGSCIAQFPKLDSLQKIWGDNLQIILVNSFNTGDNVEKIKQFFKKRKNRNGETFNFVVAIEDSVATEIFPHVSLPHYAWITKENRWIRSITASDEISNSNIKSIVSGEFPSMSLKKDFFPNQLINVPSKQAFINDELPCYKVFKKGKLDGLNPTINTREEQCKQDGSIVAIPRGKAMINVRLLDMYFLAMQHNQTFVDKNAEKRLILQMTDSSDFVFKHGKLSQEEWEKQNLYYYDIIVPRAEVDKLYSIILEDLNHYSAYYGKVEKRKVLCKILIDKKTPSISGKKEENQAIRFASLQKRRLKNITTSEATIELDFSLRYIKMPFIDESNYKDKIDLEFTEDRKDFEDIRKYLQKNYGLDIIEEEREIDVFVISKK